jgi:hypothetical protein
VGIPAAANSHACDAQAVDSQWTRSVAGRKTRTEDSRHAHLGLSIESPVRPVYGNAVLVRWRFGCPNERCQAESFAAAARTEVLTPGTYLPTRNAFRGGTASPLIQPAVTFSPSVEKEPMQAGTLSSGRFPSNPSAAAAHTKARPPGERHRRRVRPPGEGRDSSPVRI